MFTPLQEYPPQYCSDTPIPTIIPRPMMSLSPSLEHDIQLMEALVVEELEAEANPKQEHDLLVKIVHETMLQPRQEVLCSTVDREKTPPALPIYI